MTSIYSANGYQIVACALPTRPHDGTLPGLCLDVEISRADGYACFAMRDGRIVADADGCVLSGGGPSEHGAYSHAAGYQD